MLKDFGLYCSNVLSLIIAVYSFLKKGNGEGSFELFSVVSSARMHGNGSKLHQEAFLYEEGGQTLEEAF